MAGLTIERHFTKDDPRPESGLDFEERTAEIRDDKGEVIFTQRVTVPRSWSPLATNVASGHYLFGDKDGPPGDPSGGGREDDIRQAVHRIARWLSVRGIEGGYFADRATADRFQDEFVWLVLRQYGSPNSPVWYNVGVAMAYGIKGSPSGLWRWDPQAGEAVPCEDSYTYPQGSACFIQSVQDSMDDIMRLAASEAHLFKFGSGTGTDLSTLRSTREKLAGGGKPSGPVSFLKVYDAIAGVIKSGGKTRRAAKMNTLKVHHPDILEFVRCKAHQERMAHALAKEGFDPLMDGEIYSSLRFQNANLSVRVTDEFLESATAGCVFALLAVTTGEMVDSYSAHLLLDEIAEAAHACGDPGVQYEDTIQRWHTCPNSGPINSSNPCAEYMFLDDSACNLFSLNLMKFRRGDGSFNVEDFRAAVRIFHLAQEIMVDHLGYPTKAIAENSHKFRPLGLGYANLGALLMSLGLPYDSEAGRDLAAAITAYMHGLANEFSTITAEHLGAFEGYRVNRLPMLKVMTEHRNEVVRKIHGPRSDGSAAIWDAAINVWNRVIARGQEHGFRNAQVTLLAPTGTIAFLMDCDTFGIEPDYALVKRKAMAGGGVLEIVNRTVPMALDRLGYHPDVKGPILKGLARSGRLECLPEHRGIFACAQDQPGIPAISWEGHVRMMAAVQPFLSGAISKTVNMPAAATKDDIRGVYVLGWELGLKALAVFRDGCKATQPLSAKGASDAPAAAGLAADDLREAPGAGLEPGPAVASLGDDPGGGPEDRLEGLRRDIDRGRLPDGPRGRREGPVRDRLPHTRPSLTHKFDVGGFEGYMTVGCYPPGHAREGQAGELFIAAGKDGSTIGSLLDSIGVLVSVCLQYRIPIDVLTEKFRGVKSEPNGPTPNRAIPFAKSLVDYIFTWLSQGHDQGWSPWNVPQETPVESVVVDLPPGVTESSGPLMVPQGQHLILRGHDPATAEDLRDADRVWSEAMKMIHTRPVGKHYCNGYTGAICSYCQSHKMRRAGTCDLCENCGLTTGC
jgi:ribonucleoside-diphosphate reductase alpha chain